MSEESVTLRAIQIARLCLKDVLSHPEALVQMAANDVSPGDVEDVVAVILGYLDRTAEEKKPAKEDTLKILEIAESYIYQPSDFEEYNRRLSEGGFKERTPPEVGRHG